MQDYMDNTALIYKFGLHGVFPFSYLAQEGRVLRTFMFLSTH